MRANAVRPLVLAALAAAPLVARPHDIPRESVMNAFVRVEARRAELVVRVPLLLLGSMSFPAAATRELDLASAGPAIERALGAVGREIVLSDGGRVLVPEPLAARLSLPSDRSFESYDEAVAHVRSAPAPRTVIYADQGFFDAHYGYALPEGPVALSVETRVVRALREHLVLALRYSAGGDERAYRLTSLDGEVALDPRWWDAARSFARSGSRHILDGIDHLLFLLCVVLPLRRPRALLGVVTSFTVAHSTTLFAAAYGLTPGGEWFPPLVEVLIAASILYMAVENVLVAAPRRRWLVTGAFGLVHGFGFASALARDLQFAGDHLVVSLLAFNVGVELGQILALAAAIPALWLISRAPVLARHGTAVASVLAGHAAWHWLAERVGPLRAAVAAAPEGTFAALVPAAVAAVAAAVAGGVLLRGLRRRAAAAPGSVRYDGQAP